MWATSLSHADQHLEQWVHPCPPSLGQGIDDTMSPTTHLSPGSGPGSSPVVSCTPSLSQFLTHQFGGSGPIKFQRCQGEPASSWAPQGAVAPFALTACSAVRHTCSGKEAFTICHWKLRGVIQWVAAFLQRAIKIPFGNAIASLPSCITLLFKEGASDTLKHTHTGKKDQDLLNLKTIIILCNPYTFQH